MKFTILQFLALVKLACQFWPYSGSKRDQIQTYAIINDFDQLSDDFLSQYSEKKDTPLFYSRRWADNQYNPSETLISFPALVLYEPDNSIIITKPFETSRSKTEYTFQVYIVDQFIELDPDINGEDFRTIQDIYIACENMMKAFFYFLANEAVAATINGGSTLQLTTEGYLARQVIQNEIDSYSIDSVETERLRQMLIETSEITIGRITSVAQELYGVLAEINIRTVCDTHPSWDFTVRVPNQVVPDQGQTQYPEAEPVLLSLNGDELGDLVEPEDLGGL